MKKYWDQIKAQQIDVLKEIGNIGAGNAATALAQLVKHSVDMNVPYVSVLSFDEVAEYLGGPEEVVASVFLKVEGDVPGNMYFFLKHHTAKQIIKKMLGQSSRSDKNEFEELEISVLQELGNILSGSYMSALSDLTRLNIQPSVPAFTIDMAGAILTCGLLEVGKTEDFALIIDTQFSNVDQVESPLSGQFVLLPNPESLPILFKALGVPMYE